MKKMRFTVLFLILALAAGWLAPAMPAAALYELPETRKVYAPTAMVVSLGGTAEEDVILFEREADRKVDNHGSMVNLMVGIVAMEIIGEKNLDMDTATGTYTSRLDGKYVTGTGISIAHMNFLKEETWTLRDLLSVIMCGVAADACVTLSSTLAGSEEAFVERMNAKAAELGCTGTAFTNTYGRDDPGQYTTVRDLYRIMRCAMDFPQLVEMMSNTGFTVNPVKNGSKRYIDGNNEMPKSSNINGNYYAPLEFGRRGAYSMVGVAKDSGYEYLCVVANCPTQKEDGTKSGYLHYDDLKQLFRWAFNNFQYQTLLNKNEPQADLPVTLAWNKDKVILVPAQDFATIVSNEVASDPKTVNPVVTLSAESVEAPVEKGQVLGKVELYINVDQKIGEVPLVASESIERSQILAAWASVEKFLQSPWFYGTLILLAVLLLAYIILNVVHNRHRKRHKMRRVKKYK